MSVSIEPLLVETYRFRSEDLRPATRLPGISAFMRVKNGAAFLEATIRSHMAHLDEIVAVYNQCTDATPEILARLSGEFGDRLRVFHYKPKVFAPGSDGHAREPPDSPASFVNQSNFALAQTRFRVAVKLDDDHLAMGGRLAALTARIRAADYRLDRVLCFSGINLARDESGKTEILAHEPFSGNGDIGFFEVTPCTRFIHHLRFEDFDHAGKRREFCDFTYWHMKYLKSGFGFSNRDIGQSNARFLRKYNRFIANRRMATITELVRQAPAGLGFLAALPLPDKAKLKIDRWRRLQQAPPNAADLDAALRQAGVA